MYVPHESLGENKTKKGQMILERAKLFKYAYLYSAVDLAR